MSAVAPFWKTKSLSDMSAAEWESLCDGCGKCCLVLIEDEDDGAVYEADVGCRLYDAENRRCTDYDNRHERVPDCVRLTPENAGSLKWMPQTCAYRLLANGEDLPDWHPLVTGDPSSTARTGNAAPKNLGREEDFPGEKIFSRKLIERFSPQK